MGFLARREYLGFPALDPEKRLAAPTSNNKASPNKRRALPWGENRAAHGNFAARAFRLSFSFSCFRRRGDPTLDYSTAKRRYSKQKRMRPRRTHLQVDTR